MKNQNIKNRTTSLLRSLSCGTASIILLFHLATPSPAATLSWSGGSATTANWSDSGNWGFAGTPNNGDTLIFSASQPRQLNTNNIVGLTLAQIRFVGPGGGYSIWGNSFTIANGSIEATNTAGANTINNDNTLGGSNVTVNVGSATSLTLAGALGGGGGLTKNGTGTLTYSGSVANSYSGATVVNAGLLQLGKVPTDGSINAGSLTINSATVREIVGYQMGSIPVTINSGGLLDLNGFSDAIGNSLTLNNGDVQTGAGTLYLLSNPTITASGSPSSISGNLSIGGSGTCTIQGTGGLTLSANVSGSANIVKNGSVYVMLYGANTFTGTFTANTAGYVYVLNDLGLGATNGGTIINDSAFLAIGSGIDVTNEALTMNTSYSTYGIDAVSGTNSSWKGSVTLSRDTDIYVSTSFEIVGLIDGGGGLAKFGAGTLTFSGSGENTFSGDMVVNTGLLQLNQSGGGHSLSAWGSLIIGDGVGGANADIVRYINANGNQIYAGRKIIINSSGLLDLNGHSDDVGPIYMDGANITTGAGTLQLAINPLATFSSTNGGSTIAGNLLLSSGSLVVSNDLTITAVVSGSAALTKTGSGNLYLQGANTYTGVTAIQQGFLWAQNSLALGTTTSGTTVSNGACLGLDGSASITNESLTLNGAGPYSYGSLDVEGGIHTWAGPITNNANSTLDAYNGGSELHINGPISGAGALELFNYITFGGSSGGSIYFEGAAANTYAGSTTVDPGCTLLLNKTAYDGAIPNVLNINGTVRNLRDYQIANSSTVTIGASGFLDLSGVISTSTILASPVHTNIGSGSYTLGYAFTPNTNLTVTAVRHYFGTKVEIWTDTGTLLASQNVTSVPGTWVETPLSTPIQLTAGTRYRVAAYTAGGNYYWRTDLGGTFPYGSIDQSYEISGDAFPTSTDTVRWWFVDLRYNAVLPSCGDSIGSLNGSGSVDLGNNYINSVGTGTHTYNGVISGSGTFYVDASGLTYTLNGNNTYTGQTYLYDGYTSTVKINGSQPQSPVYVGNLATLGGSGTVGTITANGTISPGNSPGILNSSNVTFSGTGKYIVELTGPTAGTNYDQLNVTGTNILANATLTVIPAFTTPVAIGQKFTIVNNDGADAISGTFSGLAEGATATVGGFGFQISYIGGTGNDVVLTVLSTPINQAGSKVTTGNGDASISPNECNSLLLAITNKTGTAMTGISASLSSSDPNVVVTQPGSTYPNAPANGKSTNVVPFQVSTLPSFSCGSNVTLNLTLTTASHGSFTTPIVLNSGAPASIPVRFDNNVATGIPDVGSVDSTNLVAGFVGPLQKVSVSLWLTHTFDSDLSLSLISPDGTTVPLTIGIGAGANFGSGSADANRTTFDDAAATAITASAPPYVGTFRPQGTLGNFNFNPTPNGAWKLRVTDSFGGSLGTLRNWSLFLYGTQCAEGGGACALCSADTLLTNTLTTGSAILSPRLNRNTVVSSCGTPKAYPGSFAGSFNYNAYPFYNGSSSACISVTLTSFGADVMASAYLGSFNPTNPAANYLGDFGNSTSGAGTNTFSFTAPSNSVFVVVVNNVGAVGTYSLAVSGGDCSPVLNIAAAGASKVDVNWPTVAGGYNLEATNALTAPVWPGVTNEPVASGNRFHVTNSSVPLPSQFYRLHQP